MGTYRTLVHDSLACPYCRHESAYQIQFKYGACECDEVRLGGEIQWVADLRNCYGRPIGGRVKLSGCPVLACPRCDREAEAVLTVDNDRLVEVELTRELPELGPEGVLQLGGQKPAEARAAVKGKNRYVECPTCRWKSDTCTDTDDLGHVYCERCGQAISRESWCANSRK